MQLNECCFSWQVTVLPPLNLEKYVAWMPMLLNVSLVDSGHPTVYAAVGMNTGISCVLVSSKLISCLQQPKVDSLPFYLPSIYFCNYADINECDSGLCIVNSVCTNLDGSFTCACSEGYTGDGFTNCTG